VFDVALTLINQPSGLTNGTAQNRPRSKRCQPVQVCTAAAVLRAAMIIW
jgi:hypothetical protein